MAHSLDDQIRFWTTFNSWSVGSAAFGALVTLVATVLAGIAYWRLGPLQDSKEDVLRNRLKTAEERAGTTEEQLALTKKQLADTEKSAREARELGEQLELKQRPRRLTAEQKESLIVSLKNVPQKAKLFISASILDAEAIAFAEDIEAVLLAAGFEVHFPKGIEADSTLSVGPPGAHIVVKDPKVPHPLAARLQRCFTDSGITLPGIMSGDPQFEADRLEIAIGQK